MESTALPKSNLNNYLHKIEDNAKPDFIQSKEKIEQQKTSKSFLNEKQGILSTSDKKLEQTIAISVDQ